MIEWCPGDRLQAQSRGPMVSPGAYFEAPCRRGGSSDERCGVAGPSVRRSRGGDLFSCRIQVGAGKAISSWHLCQCWSCFSFFGEAKIHRAESFGLMRLVLNLEILQLLVYGRGAAAGQGGFPASPCTCHEAVLSLPNNNCTCECICLDVHMFVRQDIMYSGPAHAHAVMLPFTCIDSIGACLERLGRRRISIGGEWVSEGVSECVRDSWARAGIRVPWHACACACFVCLSCVLSRALSLSRACFMIVLACFQFGLKFTIHHPHHTPLNSQHDASTPFACVHSMWQVSIQDLERAPNVYKIVAESLDALRSAGQEAIGDFAIACLRPRSPSRTWVFPRRLHVSRSSLISAEQQVYV